ncbi:hypothetical protein GW17_00061800, partial [Ensete ventricosum]
IQEKGFLKAPKPMKSRAEDRDCRCYRRFLRDYRHDTEECYYMPRAGGDPGITFESENEYPDHDDTLVITAHIVNARVRSSEEDDPGWVGSTRGPAHRLPRTSCKPLRLVAKQHVGHTLADRTAPIEHRPRGSPGAADVRKPQRIRMEKMKEVKRPL